MKFTIKNKLLIRCGLIFILFFFIFLLRQLAIDGFYGTDAYYHTKHAWLMADEANLSLVQPWLEFHFFKYAPTDPWWGHHLVLAGLIYFFGPILGAKILAAILAALIFVVFYFILNKLQAKQPLVWTWLFFSASIAFQMRLFLARPLLLSISFLPLAFYLCWSRKYWWLFGLSCLYALMYNLAPLILVVTVFYFLIDWVSSKQADLKVLLASLAGLALGILIHPNSLNYLYIIYMHLWQVLYLKFSGLELGVGSEIHLKGFLSFVRSNFISLTFYLVALAIFFAVKAARSVPQPASATVRAQVFSGQEQTATTALALISGCFLALTMLVPRAGDYMMPFVWLLVAVVISNLGRSRQAEEILDFIKDRLNLTIAKFFLISVISILIIYNYSQLVFNLGDLQADNKAIYLEQANNWLVNHTEPGSLVFHNRWDIWPLMFYYNSHNHFLVGMDPTFLYEYDPALFWLWYNIGHYGIYCDQESGLCPNLSPLEQIKLIKSGIKEQFRSDYILLENQPELDLLAILNNYPEDYQSVYSNEQFVIFAVR
jgi:hypothetical protein